MSALRAQRLETRIETRLVVNLAVVVKWPTCSFGASCKRAARLDDRGGPERIKRPHVEPPKASVARRRLQYQGDPLR